MKISVKEFKELYENKSIMLDWTAEDLRLRISKDYSQENLKEESDKQEFLERVFEITTEIRSYIVDRNYSPSDLFQEIQREYGSSFNEFVIDVEKELNKNHPNLDTVTIEYLTKRSRRNVKKVIDYTAFVKIETSEDKVEFETTEDGLDKMIEALMVSSKDLKELKDNE